MTTNLVHNAIVHNMPELGTVWVTASAHPKCTELTVESTGDKLTPQLVSTPPRGFASPCNYSPRDRTVADDREGHRLRGPHRQAPAGPSWASAD